MNNVIIVWKDGTYKEVDKNSAWEFENDKNWLATIPSAGQQREEKDKEIDAGKFLDWAYTRCVRKHISSQDSKGYTHIWRLTGTDRYITIDELYKIFKNNL